MAASSMLSEYTYGQLAAKNVCSQETADTLESLGFTKLTKIQSKVLPNLLLKENCYIHARTGSGKTLAYLVPTLERLKAMKFKKSHGIGALIISPTRELAKQIDSVLRPLAVAHGLSSSMLIGGLKSNAKTIKGSVIVVATPGILLCEVLEADETNSSSVRNLKVLILDEADKLLGNGSHTERLRKIYSFLPEENLQKVLVSATISDDHLQLAKSVLQEEKDFRQISTETDSLSTTEQIKQSYISVKAGDRLSMLITVLKTLRKRKVVVFFNSCHSVKFHYAVLSKLELPVLQCFGQDKQIHRLKAYSKFSELKQGILLTTGLAERGWDIPDVRWIIIYDPPHIPEDYIHRVGRTGRGVGQVGQALLFLRPEESEFIQILKNMKINISLLEFEGDLVATQSQVTTLMEENKDLQEKAKIAYKKFVRAYQCHKLKKIFSVKSMDLNDACKSFGFVNPPMYLGHLT